MPDNQPTAEKFYPYLCGNIGSKKQIDSLLELFSAEFNKKKDPGRRIFLSSAGVL
jgi:hypothetical protein